MRSRCVLVFVVHAVASPPAYRLRLVLLLLGAHSFATTRSATL